MEKPALLLMSRLDILRLDNLMSCILKKLKIIFLYELGELANHLEASNMQSVKDETVKSAKQHPITITNEILNGFLCRRGTIQRPIFDGIKYHNAFCVLPKATLLH